MSGSRSFWRGLLRRSAGGERALEPNCSKTTRNATDESRASAAAAQTFLEAGLFVAGRVIEGRVPRHYLALALDLLTGHPAQGSSSTDEAQRLPPTALRRLVKDHYDFLWRLLARLNVSGPEVDDARNRFSWFW